LRPRVNQPAARHYVAGVGTAEGDNASLTVRPLASDTWDAFAALAERNNGIFGGCWCTWFHRRAVEGLGDSRERNKEIKEQLVREGRSRAALVFDGDEAVAWCQFGTPDELPNIYHRKEYLEQVEQLPDYRVTCIFVDKRYRRRGVTGLALAGALDLIAEAGGGTVEGYPHDPEGKRVAVLYDGTRSVFERAGFTFVRRKGPRNTVMVKVVPPAS
jgi:GNAT superfamily N-acetyltransferase